MPLLFGAKQTIIAMISFIVTTYNLEDWLLRRCLDSIVAQELSRDQYEIIVVDDESAVSPKHVVESYARQADISLYVQQHARQGAARNLGIRYAKGEWIQFVDGDDYLFADTTALIIKAAQDKELDLLMFGHQEVYGNTPKRHACSTHTMSLSSTTTGDTYMLHHNLFGSCCMQIFRKTLLDDPIFGTPLRFTEGIYVEDEEFVTKLVWRAQRMACTDVSVYAYYQRENSTVHCRSIEHTDELFRSYFVALRRLRGFESSLESMPHAGITRKVHFLALDILRRALREPDWKRRWNESVQQLRSLELYPLPSVHYSWKYSLFRLLTKSALGRHILWLLEKREKK